MSAEVLKFPTRFTPREDHSPQIEAVDQVRPMKRPLLANRPTSVVISTSMFERMVDALTFYAKSGFDHGALARLALSPDPLAPSGDAA